MEQPSAIAALSALAHQGRLEAFRLLVKAGPEGLAAGDIARALGSLPNTLSANLNILSASGLVTSQRHGRSIRYAADYAHMRAVIAFLMEDCCAGAAEICGPLAETARRACA
ncbi:MAG: ArsR family transcriptional regulator [Caulobacteraceae bacterium]|nr:ArsR family transcriptional regulator [Caulobacteraceae bacterium]